MQNRTEHAISPIKIPALTIRWAPKTTAAEVITSLSLPQAKILPLKVMPPITIDSRIVTSVNVVLPTLYSAAQPTMRLAIPPEPLKRATISGMLVISTFWAAMAPITAPTAAATKINWKERISLLKSVTPMAMTMASEDRMLPRTAVAGEPSCFRPKMNSAAATTYHRLIMTGFMTYLRADWHLSF